MKREPTVESLLKWALKNGYSFADLALGEYCRNRNLEWKADYQGLVTFDGKQAT